MLLLIVKDIQIVKEQNKPSMQVCFSGGGERVRTDDLLRARQALSQLSYTPEKTAQKNGGPGWS
jgi:hypothetical protein